jgi:excisionase family DNA binding protein
MSTQTVSAGEAARRLGVTPITIQRWVDRGILNAERTAGGHRRIYVTELRRLIAESRPAALSGPLASWLDVLMTGNPHKIRSALITARQNLGNWAKVADQVASAISELGRRWEAGTCPGTQSARACGAVLHCARRKRRPNRMPAGLSCSRSKGSAIRSD